MLTDIVAVVNVRSLLPRGKFRRRKSEVRNPNVETATRNDEIRMTKLEGMTNDQMTKDCSCHFFVIRALCFLRHSTFVLRHFLDYSKYLQSNFARLVKLRSKNNRLTAFRPDANHGQLCPG